MNLKSREWAKCEWRIKQDFDEEYWSTECGTEFVFIADGPEENSYKYCPNCGRKIQRGQETNEEMGREQ